MSTPVRILADATLPGLSALFQPPFALTLYHNQDNVRDLLANQDILLCRSTLRVCAKLLTDCSIQCVATASSGTDHIDGEYLSQRNIQLFDAKGSNAKAVADWVVATLAALQTLKTPRGKLAGVIGVGEVGSRVVARLRAAGFDVVCFDPIKAQEDKNHVYGTLNDLIACDVLCVHANLHESALFPSKNLLNAQFLAQLKPGATIINASRGGIVNEEALLNSTNPITYCTDVYCNEPTIDPRLVEFATICTPHIAGHSIEAKQAAVVQVSQQLHQYYGLTMPTAHLPIAHDIPVNTVNKSGQEIVLNLYNPLQDTLMLKSATDKESAFLTQRKAHQYRHDFDVYWTRGLEKP